MNTNEVTQAIADAWIAEWNRILDMPSGAEKDACLREHNRNLFLESFNVVRLFAAMNPDEETQAIVGAWLAKWNRIMDTPEGPEKGACAREHGSGLSPESFNVLGIITACQERIDRECQKSEFEVARTEPMFRARNSLN